MSDKAVEHGPWPARAAGLAVLGALLAVACERLLPEGPIETARNDALRLSLASFVAVFGFVLGFTLERARALWSALFALGCATIVALIFYWNGTPAGWSAGDEWRVFSALLVVAIAEPLFQTMRDAGRRTLDSAAVHAHAWTNIVLWFATWAFVAITFLLAHLLAELFNLIGIDLLRDAMREAWFVAAIVGTALGGAIGLLRDRDKVLANLQRVVTTVLSVLAPVLAAGLVLFVAALPFTGLTPLWDKTSATTPILLLAVAGALVLANAVIGNSTEEEAKGKALRLSAVALAAVMLPLAIVAAISTWLRIDQHGYTPERLWAAVFVAIVLAIAATYLWTVARGRLAWAERARPANVRLALGISAVALVLATPLINFGALATRDQLARLQSGRVSPDAFDWAALRFDFGPTGRAELRRLSQSSNGAIRARATEAIEAFAKQNRWDADGELNAQAAGKLVRVLPAQVQLPPGLLESFFALQRGMRPPLVLFYRPGDREAILVSSPCEDCLLNVTVSRQSKPGIWMATESAVRVPNTQERRAKRAEIEGGAVELRQVPRRQVFVNGKPVGDAFE